MTGTLFFLAPLRLGSFGVSVGPAPMVSAAEVRFASKPCDEDAMFSTEIVVIGEVMGRWDSRVADERERAIVPRTLSEIASESGWQFVNYEGRIHAMASEWLRTASEYAPLLTARDKGIFDHLMPPSFVKLTCQIQYPDEYVDNYLQPSSPEDDLHIPRDQIEHLISDDLSKDVAGILVETVLAANIARAGSLSYSSVFRFANNELRGIDGGIPGIAGDVTMAAIDIGWPTLYELALSDVVPWLYRVPGFGQRQTQTRLGRALAAATHILLGGQGKQALHLVWALLGLEALYARGNFGLQQQLAEKTEVFLGPRTTHKKKISNMYDFRSRFLHGDIDLLYPHNAHHGARRYDALEAPMYESENTAIAVLFATLQRMCREERDRLDFIYQVVSDASG